MKVVPIMRKNPITSIRVYIDRLATMERSVALVYAAKRDAYLFRRGIVA